MGFEWGSGAEVAYSEDVVVRLLGFLRGQGDVDALQRDPPELLAHLYNNSTSQVRIVIDPVRLRATHAGLWGNRVAFLDAASKLSVSLFETLLDTAVPGSTLHLDPDGDGFIADPARPKNLEPVVDDAQTDFLRVNGVLSRTAMATYVIDGSGVDGPEDFFRAIGEAVNGPGGYFGDSLDGLNDCLGGGMGSADGEIQFRWTHSVKARTTLGKAATVQRLQVSPSQTFVNRRYERERLHRMKRGQEPTFFESIVSVFDDAGVTLVLE